MSHRWSWIRHASELYSIFCIVNNNSQMTFRTSHWEMRLSISSASSQKSHDSNCIYISYYAAYQFNSQRLVWARAIHSWAGKPTERIKRDLPPFASRPPAVRASLRRGARAPKYSRLPSSCLEISKILRHCFALSNTFLLCMVTGDGNARRVIAQLWALLYWES